MCSSASAQLFGGVREADLQAWVGRPVADLDKHPIFLTMRVVRTRTADGTEIRNYVNGRNISSCSAGGIGSTIFGTTVDMETYSKFSNCMRAFAACNNIFYIKNGLVTQYSPIGTGGQRCYTNETLRPGFTGAANIN